MKVKEGSRDVDYIDWKSLLNNHGIEIQLIGDKHGNTVKWECAELRIWHFIILYFFYTSFYILLRYISAERECSV